MNDIGEVFKTFGWPGGMLIVTLGSIAVVMRFLKERLFNDELDPKGRPKGYVPKVVEAHVDMVQAVKMASEANAKTGEDNARTNKEILLLVREQGKMLGEMHHARIEQLRQESPKITGLGSV